MMKLSTNSGKFTVSSFSPSLFLSLESSELDSLSFLYLSGTSKEIPRFQRRGAIITLGMFAQPKPEVVADHVETLLKIGLGSLGRVKFFFSLSLSLFFFLRLTSVTRCECLGENSRI